jgi:hypothetical protein
MNQPETRKLLELFSREMDLYKKLLGGQEPTRKRLRPGTPEFMAAAKNDCEEQVALYQGPGVSPSFLVHSFPRAVAIAVERFESLHQGIAQVSLNTIDGHLTYRVQIVDEVQAEVLLVDASGRDLGTGTIFDAQVVWL